MPRIWIRRRACAAIVLTQEDSEAATYDKATKEFASRMAAAKAESENLPDASEIAALIDKDGGSRHQYGKRRRATRR